MDEYVGQPGFHSHCTPPKSYDCGIPYSWVSSHIFLICSFWEPHKMGVGIFICRWWSPVAHRTIRFWYSCSFHRRYVYSKSNLHVLVSNQSAISYQSQFPLRSWFCLYAIPMVTGKHNVQSADSDARLAESNWWLPQFISLFLYL